MNKKRLIYISLLIMVFVVAFALMYQLLAKPVHFEYTMYGTEIDSGGNIVREFTFTINGTDEKIRSEVHTINAEIDFHGTDVPSLIDTQIIGTWHDDYSTTLCYMTGLTFSTETNRYSPVTFGLSTDGSSCLIILPDTNTMIVGCRNSEYDYSAILKMYESMT